MKERIDTVVTVVLTICALVITGLLAHRHLLPRDSGEHGYSFRTAAPPVVAEWGQYAAEGHVRGSREAPVTIVAFSDFECPACKVFASYIPELLREFDGELAVVHRHFPMRFHAYAVPAARASECAAAQGGFERFHDVVFTWQDSLPTWSWRRFGELAKLTDLDEFDRCQASASPVPSLDRDSTAGLRLKVTGTPTLLINDRRLNGVPPLEVLKQHVREELGESTR